MVKTLVIILITCGIYAGELEKNCINCHANNRLPTKLIYKRYLMKYSTKDRMKKAMFNYLKNPTIKNSIMPKQFFLKFSTKNVVKLDNKTLSTNIDLFLEKYDIKKQLK